MFKNTYVPLSPRLSFRIWHHPLMWRVGFLQTERVLIVDIFPLTIYWRKPLWYNT